MAAVAPDPKIFIGDKGFDSDDIRHDIEDRGGVIPMRKHRKVQTPIDAFIYAMRNRIERAFNKLKCSRRLATRYDKTEASFLAFVHLASLRLWIRHFVNST